jgi:hypothetical protein
MKKIVLGIIAVALASASPLALAQEQRAEIQQRLQDQFAITQLTPDKSDVLRAGTVVSLQKDGLLMCTVNTGNGVTNRPATSVYKDGKISQDFALGPAVVTGRRYVRPKADCGNTPQRVFVTGETLWVIKAYADEEKVTFRLASDPVDNVRYWGELQIPYAGSPTDQLMSNIDEVLKVRPSDNAEVVPPAPDNLAPPNETPPPAPKTISLGQPKDEVVEVLGPPKKIVKLGAKEMDYYPDMKVTLVDGKVADVQ